MNTVTVTTVLDECASSPCQNGGVCVDEYLAFSCNCVGTNHTGNLCQQPLHTCESYSHTGISFTTGIMYVYNMTVLFF
jgi:hypothetical protein